MRQFICISLISIFVTVHGKDVDEDKDTIYQKLESHINGIIMSDLFNATHHLVPINQQFIYVTTKALLEPLQLIYNLSSEKQKVLFNISDVVQQGDLDYSESLVFTHNATKAEQSFIIVFQCLEDGNHKIVFTLQHKTEIVDLTFLKQCGKISNKNLYIELKSEQLDEKYNQKITVVQDQETHLKLHKSLEISFELYLYTLTDQQILMDAPKIEYKDKSQQSQLALVQSAQFRNNDKRGGLLCRQNKLIINIKFSCLQVSDVNYTLTINSQIFDTPYTFDILQSCAQNQINEPISVFTEFPIVIGTIKDGFDVYRPGQIASEYNKSSTHVRVIPEEEDAEMFYVKVMDNKYGEDLLKKDFLLRTPILEYNKNILDITNAQQFWRKPLDILLIFKCRRAGKSSVKMELDFQYKPNITQTIPIHFVKICGDVKLNEETTFLGDFFYYSLCLLAIMFGLFVIKLFKKMMMREAAQESFNIDTSYKRKYDNIQELSTQTNIQDTL